MALIKHRPRIRLMLAPELTPGETFVATVVIEARRSVPIHQIEVDFEGTEERSIGSGQYKLVRRRNICYLRANVETEGELPAGRSRYRCRFTLPQGAPPTYVGDRIRVSYLMNVRAAIPWWPDAKASFEVNVGYRKDVKVPESKPLLFSSRVEGPAANEPHVEGSLASVVMVPGTTASGAIALSNVEYIRYSGLRLAVVGIEKVIIGSRTSRHEAHRYEIHMPIEDPVEGKQYEFRMRLPDRVPTTYHGAKWSLSWLFECKAEIRWAQDLALRVPITMTPRKLERPKERTEHAPPTVGSERVRRIWSEVAARHDLLFDDRRIYGRAAGVDVAIERQHRGRMGVYLVGTLSYPPLHLELEIEPARGWRKAGDRGVQLGERRWDRDHLVTCRDPSQLKHIAPVLHPGLIRFRSVQMGDHRAVAELRNSGASRSRLDEFVFALLDLARSVDRARDRIPPPAAMQDCVASWHKLADAVAGELDKARMAVTGVVSGMAIEVETRWSPSSEPLLTALTVRPTMTIDPSLHESRAAGPDDEVSLDDLPGPAPVIERSAAGALIIDIEAEAVRVKLPAPTADAHALLPRLRAMVEWAKHLSGSAGPYR